MFVRSLSVILACAGLSALAGGTEQAAPLHVLKIAAGPAGAPSNGRFVLTEERAVFSRTEDREVIVSFEWEGAPGQPAGRFTFEVTDATPPVGAAVVSRQPLGQSELYERLQKVFVHFDRFSSEGRSLDAVSGVLGAGGRIYTSMAAVDDVDRLRAVLPGGTAQDVTALFGWNRGEDWAVVEVAPSAVPNLPVAPAASVKVGDRCFSMEGSPAGGSVLVELSITGNQLPRPATGWLATFLNGFGTPGAPVVNEYGELLGIVGASPGGTRLAFVMRNRADLKGVPIVPFSLMGVANESRATAIADLRGRGELIPVLIGEQNILSGGFAREIARTNTIAPSDQREEFSAKEGKMVAFVTWSPVERVRGMATFALFDAGNRLVVKSAPKKVSLNKGQLSLSSWQLGIANLDGLYRGDVMIDNKPMWRGFVKIVP
jgi:S1-C subfamily serine protease